MNNPEARVTAVIVTYQSRDTIGAALDALQEAVASGLARVVVVDNASSDGTADLVATEYPWVTLIRSDHNLGFGRGCNLGFKEVDTQYALILNPDARVTPAALQTMLNFMESTARAGIVAPAIVERQSSMQAAGLMTTPSTLLRGAFGRKDTYHNRRVIHADDPPFRTSWVCGAVMLIRSSLFRTLGGFDPRFFLYFEETDLCRRATAHGAEIWAVGSAVATHIGGASARKVSDPPRESCINEHYYRSRFYYLVKHFGWFRAVSAEVIVSLIQSLRFLRNRLTGRVKPHQSAESRRPFLRFPMQPGDVSS